MVARFKCDARTIGLAHVEMDHLTHQGALKRMFRRTKDVDLLEHVVPQHNPFDR